MKRFVEYFPKYDLWGDRIYVENEINRIAESNNLTIVTISATENGVYVLFEKGGE